MHQFQLFIGKKNHLAKLRPDDVLRRPQKNFLATLGRPHVVLNVTPRGHQRRDVLGTHSGRHFNHNPQNGLFWIFLFFLILGISGIILPE